MKDLIDMTMQTVKRIYMDLRPGMLDHLGLPVAMDWQCQEFQKHTGIQCTVDVEPEDMEPNKDASITVFRILQETLTNVAKHSKADKGQGEPEGIGGRSGAYRRRTTAGGSGKRSSKNRNPSACWGYGSASISGGAR